MKASLMFRKGFVPPQVGIPEKLGTFDCLNRGSVLIPGEPVSFTRQSVGKKRTMIVNNFDAAVSINRHSSHLLESIWLTLLH